MNHLELMVAIRIWRPSYPVWKSQDSGFNMMDLNCVALEVVF